ncbi:MAG: hypothetical protein AAF798_11635 [Bacteroidota bacterium]
MLEHWLRPPPQKDFAAANWHSYQIGHQILRLSKEISDLKAVQVAIVGIEAKAANAIRKALYALSMPFDASAVVDLGNVRKKDPNFVIPLFKELLESNILPIVLGPDPSLAIMLYKALLEQQSLLSLVAIDQAVPFRGEGEPLAATYLDELLDQKAYQPFHVGLIGVQRHLTPPATFDFANEQHWDCIRLGNARANLQELEPIIRNGDLLLFHLSALKRTEAPEQIGDSPIGFSLEEACQLTWYAGMSDKLKAFGVTGFQKMMANTPSTASAIALLTWYFMDGFFNRKGDFPHTSDGLVEYIVEHKKLYAQLTFWKSQRSGRWWLQVPVKTKSAHQRHRLIPCSYMDYKQATQGELPERLYDAFRRFS